MTSRRARPQDNGATNLTQSSQLPVTKVLVSPKSEVLGGFHLTVLTFLETYFFETLDEEIEAEPTMPPAQRALNYPAGRTMQVRFWTEGF